MMTKGFCLLLLAFNLAHGSELKPASCRMVYDKFNYQEEASRNFLFGEVWPNNEIPYQMSAGFIQSEVEVIESAMRHIEERVCIKWVKRSDQKNYVQIKYDKEGCFATLGYNRHRGGNHTLNLQKTDKNGSTCMIMGIAAHEMLHIMGFAHEQTRPDRDQFVKINWSSIKRDAIFNYFRDIAPYSSKRPPVCNTHSHQRSFDNCYSGRKTDTFGMIYDFGSIMHYGLDYFNTTDQATMEVIAPVPVGLTIGNREGMTSLDAQKAQAKYGCNGETTTTKKPSVECRDKYVQCPQLKDRCSFDSQIQKGCRVSCGYCKECTDRFRDCKDNAHKCGGDDVVDANCRLTCGTC